MEYKYLDPAENVNLPKHLINAGIYSENSTPKNKRPEHIPPDAVAYATQYFELARHHVPTSIRPGNNTLVFDPYKFTNDEYNSLCYTNFNY
jgi:hypothetical protein